MSNDPKDFASKTEEPISPGELAELSIALMTAMAHDQIRDAGGAGSGNFGHAGRPGEIGGSSSDGGHNLSVEDAKAIVNEDKPFTGTLPPAHEYVDGVDKYIRDNIPKEDLVKLFNGDQELEDHWRSEILDHVEPTLDQHYSIEETNIYERDHVQPGEEIYDDEGNLMEEGATINPETFDPLYGYTLQSWIDTELRTFLVSDALHKGEKFPSLKERPREKQIGWTERHAGGAGSGNFGHAGRPGEVGGSSSEGGGELGKPSSAYPAHREDGHDTRERFFDGRQYTPERQKLHEAIIEKFLKGATPVENPTAIVLGGGPATGKSSLVKAEGIGKENTVHIDPDAIKAELPEFSEESKRGNRMAGSLVHEESSDVSKMLMKRAVEGKYNLVLDGTGDSSIEKLGGKVALMRSGGHEVIGKYVSLPVEDAIRLAEARGKETGRYVPETFMRETHAAVSNTFAEALKQGLFDRADLYDTTEFGNIRHVVTATGKDVRVLNPKLWQDFVHKGTKK